MGDGPLVMDRLAWALSAVLPGVAAAPWLDVPTGDGPIGPEWPARRAAEIGAPYARDAEGGLIPDFSRVPGAADTHPDVRELYEHTGKFDLSVDPRWTPGFGIGARVWSALFARRWGQLDLPLRGDTALTNEIWRSGAPDPAQWWVRRYPDGRTLYVSRYDLVDVPGQPDRCVRITFPVPGGAWVVLFRVAHEGGAFVLTEEGGTPGGPGLYLVRRGGPARYVRAFREEIRVTPAPDGCRATHRMWVFGVPVATLAYRLPVGGPGRV